MPMRIQAINSCGVEVEVAKSARPMAKAKLPTGKTFRPPSWSMNFPTCGPKSPETNSESVKAQKNVSVEIPSDSEIGTAKMAGR